MSELNYDDPLSQSPDDDDDDIDIDLLEDIEDEKEADRTAVGTGSSQQTVQPQQSPFGNTSPWSPVNTNSSPGWRPMYNPPGNQPGQTIFPGSFNSGQPTFGGTWMNNQQYQSGSPWQRSSTPSPAIGNGKQTLPRRKKIIMCDLMDNVIEPISSGGKIGVQPQGIYDIRIKFEVLDRLRVINPEYLFILTNQNFTVGTAASKVYKSMVEYLSYSIAEYMRMPYENVRCITKTGYDTRNNYVKPNTGLMSLALKTIPDVTKKYKKEDILVVGVNSGLPGQGNRDSEMAKKFGVDYIDVQQMLYYYS